MWLYLRKLRYDFRILWYNFGMTSVNFGLQQVYFEVKTLIVSKLSKNGKKDNS